MASFADSHANQQRIELLLHRMQLGQNVLLRPKAHYARLDQEILNLVQAHL